MCIHPPKRGVTDTCSQAASKRASDHGWTAGGFAGWAWLAAAAHAGWHHRWRMRPLKVLGLLSFPRAEPLRWAGERDLHEGAASAAACCAAAAAATLPGSVAVNSKPEAGRCLEKGGDDSQQILAQQPQIAADAVQHRPARRCRARITAWPHSMCGAAPWLAAQRQRGWQMHDAIRSALRGAAKAGAVGHPVVEPRMRYATAEWDRLGRRRAARVYARMTSSYSVSVSESFAASISAKTSST